MVAHGSDSNRCMQSLAPSLALNLSRLSEPNDEDAGLSDYVPFLMECFVKSRGRALLS